MLFSEGVFNKKPKKSKIIVYTAIFGNYNKLKEVKNPSKEINYICFSDRPIKSETWTIVKGSDKFNNPVMNAKIPKILPHSYFNCDYSLWIDGSIEIIGNVYSLIGDFLSNSYDLAAFKHKTRNCPYEEAQVVIKFGLAISSEVKNQMLKYKKEGFPSNNGLTQGGVLLRKHSKKMESFNRIWWAEICKHTLRDQLSLDYAACKAGIRINHFNLPKLYQKNDHFIYHGHKKTFKHLKTLFRIAIRSRNEISFDQIKNKLPIRKDIKRIY